MLQSVKDHWRELKQGQPGRRFADHYRNRHETGGNQLHKVLLLAVGALIVAAGVFFLAVPGPGLVIIFLGGGIMAQESLTAARVLDWCELQLRGLAGWALRVWRNASIPVRAALALCALILAGSAGFLAYRVLIK